MAHVLQGLFGESSVTKLAAVFHTETDARRAQQRVAEAAGLRPGQVRLLAPVHVRTAWRDVLGRAIEPEDRGIARTLVQAHVVGGFAGVVAGLALYAWLRHADVAAVVQSPRMALGVIVGFATTFGLMLGGLIAIRPDHLRLLYHVRDGLRRGHWAVVVHPVSPEQATQARGALQATAGDVIETL